MSDPLRQVALRRDIKPLQAANECYCCVPSHFKTDHTPCPPPPPQSETSQADKVTITDKGQINTTTVYYK